MEMTNQSISNIIENKIEGFNDSKISKKDKKLLNEILIPTLSNKPFKYYIEKREIDIFVQLYFDEIKVTDVHKNEQLVKELYVEFVIYYDHDKKHYYINHLKGRRTYFSYLEYVCEAIHPHISIINNSFCLGASDCGILYNKLKQKIDKKNFEAFIFNLINFLKSESSIGAPYYNIDYIIKQNHLYNLTNISYINCDINYCLRNIDIKKLYFDLIDGEFIIKINDYLSDFISSLDNHYFGVKINNKWYKINNRSHININNSVYCFGENKKIVVEEAEGFVDKIPKTYENLVPNHKYKMISYLQQKLSTIYENYINLKNENKTNS